MKVNPKISVYLRTTEGRPAIKREISASRTAQGDSIDLSATARLLQTCLEMDEPFAGDRVKTIKNAIEKGEYAPDFSRLAESMARELTQHREIAK